MGHLMCSCNFMGSITLTKNHKKERPVGHWFVATHVVIIAVVTEVAWNVNKFCVYALSIPLFMLSNIADTVNKHTMTMAEIGQQMFVLQKFYFIKNQPLSFSVCLPCQQYYWAYNEGLRPHKHKFFLHFMQLFIPTLW